MIRKTISAIMALTLVSSMLVGSVAAVGTVNQNATDGTTSGGLDLADGETTTVSGDVSTTNPYTVRVKNASGTALTEKTGVSPSSGSVSATFDDSAILNDSSGNERVSEGDVLTIEYYDETGASVEYTADVTVSEVADGYATVDSSSDSVKVSTQTIGGLPYIGVFGSETDTADFTIDVPLNDDKDTQTVNVSLDSNTASAFDARAENASEGDLMWIDVDNAQGPVPVFYQSAGDNASEYTTYAVYDSSNQDLEVTTSNSSLNSMTLDINTAEGIQISETGDMPTVSVFDVAKHFVPVSLPF